MIHKNRGNRRWMDKRKRRHKYNLAKKICDSIKGVLGKYDKGHIYDLNNKQKQYDDYYQDGISHSDKKKVECCNDKLEYYSSGEQEHDELVDLILENDFYGDGLLEIDNET